MPRLSYIVAPGYGHLLRGTPEVKVTRFPDGEFSFTLEPHKVVGNDVIVLGGCHSAEASETMLALAYEAARFNPASLTVLITYFRNARSERSPNGEAVLAKFQANLWSGLGLVYPGVKLVFIDLHTDLILNYFTGAVRTVNQSLSFRNMLLSECFQVMSRDPLPWSHSTTVLATVDDGRASAIRKMAAAANCGFASITKKRLSGSETKVHEVHGDSVDGRDVIIIDDMVSTGSSLDNAVQAYKERGARRVFACITHGVFTEGALERLKASGLDHMLVTDSHPNAVAASRLRGLTVLGLSMTALS